MKHFRTVTRARRIPDSAAMDFVGARALLGFLSQLVAVITDVLGLMKGTPLGGGDGDGDGDGDGHDDEH